MESSNFSEAEWQCRVDLAAAYRLTDQHGLGRGIFNHIAARVPGQAAMLLMKRHELDYTEVTASNLVKVSIEQDLDESSGVNRAGYVLHAGILQARPDVNASLHFHSPEVNAVSTRKGGLRMLCQEAVQFHRRIGYHAYEGLTDALVERPRIVSALGDGVALIMRHHGAVTVAPTIGHAFTLTRLLVEACRVQLLAEAGGEDLLEIPEDICATTAAQFARHHAGRATADWPAHLRMLDAVAPAYRH